MPKWYLFIFKHLGKRSNNLWKTASTVTETWLMGIFDTDKTELIPLRFCFIFWVSEATHTHMRKAQRLCLLQSSRLNKNVRPASPPLSSVSVSVVFSFNLYLLALLCLTASAAHFSSDIDFFLKASANALILDDVQLHGHLRESRTRRITLRTCIFNAEDKRKKPASTLRSQKIICARFVLCISDRR